MDEINSVLEEMTKEDYEQMMNEQSPYSHCLNKHVWEEMYYEQYFANRLLGQSRLSGPHTTVHPSFAGQEAPC